MYIDLNNQTFKHIFVFPEYMNSLKTKGAVSHVAVVANGNLLLVVGGYSGYVMGDLRVFKFPPTIAPPLVRKKLGPSSRYFNKNIRT